MFRFRTAIISLFLIALGGCGGGAHTYSLGAIERPAPAAPRKIAFDAANVAILAGDDRSRGVFVVDPRGVVLKNFGVSPFDADLVADPSAGNLFTAYARGGVGALEKWSAAGKQLATVSLPMTALALSNVLDKTGYVLVGNDTVRTAIAFDTGTARLGRSVALPRGVSSLARADRDELAYISPVTGDLEYKSISTGLLRTTKVPGDGVTCSAPDKRCYVLNGPRAGRVIEIVNTATNLVYAQIPAFRGTSGIAVDDAGNLAVVGGDSRVGSFETFGAEALDHVTPADASP